jgi:hypothetical protein
VIVPENPVAEIEFQVNKYVPFPPLGAVRAELGSGPVEHGFPLLIHPSGVKEAQDPENKPNCQAQTGPLHDIPLPVI